MGYDYGAKLKAAVLRHKEGQTWKDVADAIGAAESTVRLWDQQHDDEWAKATEEVFAEIKREGRGVAWRGLVVAAGAGDVAACKAVLARAEGPEPQALGLHQTPGEQPVQVEAFAHLSIEDLAAIAKNGDGKHIGTGGQGGIGETGSAEGDS